MKKLVMVFNVCVDVSVCLRVYVCVALQIA